MKKPTPAQLAARARFAEMARSGAFKKGAKRKKNPISNAEKSAISFLFQIVNNPPGEKVNRTLLKKAIQEAIDAGVIVEKVESSYADVWNLTNSEGSQYSMYVDNSGRGTWVQHSKRKTNPTKKTVSQKISQLTREGYPQKQAVAVALSEQRAGKVKATPRKRNPVIPSASYDYPLINDVKLFAVNDEMLYRQQGRPIVENLARKMAKGQFDADKAVKLYGYLADSAVKKYSVDYVGSRAPTLTILSKPERQVLAQQLFEFYADEIKYAADEMVESKRKRNPATGRKGSGTKLNPADEYGYSVEMEGVGKSGLFITKAVFKSAPDAKQYARALAKMHPNRTIRVMSGGKWLKRS